MGTLQLSELREEVSLHFADRGDLTNAQIHRALNLMQERMSRAHDFQEMKTVVSGTLPYTGVPGNDKFLPFSSLSNTEPKSIFTFRLITSDGRSRKLTPWNQQLFDELVPEPEFHASRIPEHYIRWDSKFEFFPVQDLAYNYEIRLEKWPTTLADDTDKSDFNRKDELIISITVSYIYNRFGEYERSKRFFAIFDALWRVAVEEDIGKPDRNVVNPRTAADPLRLSDKYWLDPFTRSVR